MPSAPLTDPVFSKLPGVGTTIFTVMSRLAEEQRAVNLGQGFPDFEPPAALVRALSEHVANGQNQYAPMPGVLRLRRAIARRLELDYGYAPDAEHELTVTSGATEALFVAIAALVRPGDEVVLLDPSYDSYAPSVELQGAHAVHVPLLGDTFGIDFDALEAALGPRTRLVVVNFPHNPSGAVLSGHDLERLAACLRGRAIYVLSDEVYEQLVFDGQPRQSMLRHPELRERSLVVGSFGKAYHCTGWKVGWVSAPPALTRELRKVHQFVTFSTSTAAQQAFADVLEQDDGHLRGLAGFYQAKRDHFRSLLANSGLRLLPVAGAYFQLVDYSAWSTEPDQVFARRLAVEAGVVGIPLSVFYRKPPERGLLRFCFAKNDGTLEQAAERLLRFAEQRGAVAANSPATVPAEV